MITFYDSDTTTILNDTILATILKKGGLIGSKNNSYDYFIAIFESKINDYIKSNNWENDFFMKS